MHKLPAVIALSLAVSACSREAPAPMDLGHVNSITDLYAKYGCTRQVSNPVMVTIEELLASPAKFEGRPVRIEGFYYSSFEHSAIYPNAEDGARFNTKRGLWVLEGLPERYKGKRVTVEGIFTARDHGHLGQWPATICNARGFAPR